MLFDPYNQIRHVIRNFTSGISQQSFFSKHTRTMWLGYVLVAADELIQELGWLDEEQLLIFSCLMVLGSFFLQICFFQRLWQSYVSNLLLPILNIYFLLYEIGNFILSDCPSIIVPHLRWVQAILMVTFAIASVYLLLHPTFRKMNELPYNLLIVMCVGLILYYVGFMMR